MPTYTFRSKTTGNVTEEQLKIAERDQFLLDNPDLEQIHLEGIAFGDVVRLGLKKPDATFRDILKARKKKHRRSNINDY